MSGFPARIQRSDLGPSFVDAYPVENPETDIGARAFNAAFHQVAGMNLVSPRAIVVAEYSGGSLSKAARNIDWGCSTPLSSRSWLRTVMLQSLP